MRRTTITPNTARAALAALLLAVMAGCGYTVRAPFNPDIRTVYVPVVRSLSFRREENLRLTEMLQKEIEARTPFKVVGTREEADSILDGVINYLDKNIQVQNVNNLPRQLKATIAAEFRWIDVRPGADPANLEMDRVLIQETADFFPELGETAELGFQKAMERMVRQIVSMMEQPW